MATRTIKAIYRNGRFEPIDQVDLREGEEAEVSFRVGPTVEESKAAYEATMTEIYGPEWRTRPLPPTDPDSVAVNHDHFLYGASKVDE